MNKKKSEKVSNKVINYNILGYISKPKLSEESTFSSFNNNKDNKITKNNNLMNLSNNPKIPKLFLCFSEYLSVRKFCAEYGLYNEEDMKNENDNLYKDKHDIIHNIKNRQINFDKNTKKYYDKIIKNDKTQEFKDNKAFYDKYPEKSQIKKVDKKNIIIQKIYKKDTLNKKTDLYGQINDIKCLKEYPPKKPELYNHIYNLKNKLKLFKENEEFGMLNEDIVPNIFYNHFMACVNNKKFNKNNVYSITQRNKKKLITIVYYLPK